VPGVSELAAFFAAGIAWARTLDAQKEMATRRAQQQIISRRFVIGAVETSTPHRNVCAPTLPQIHPA